MHPIFQLVSRNYSIAQSHQKKALQNTKAVLVGPDCCNVFSWIPNHAYIERYRVRLLQLARLGPCMQGVLCGGFLIIQVEPSAFAKCRWVILYLLTTMTWARLLVHCLFRPSVRLANKQNLVLSIVGKLCNRVSNVSDILHLGFLYCLMYELFSDWTPVQNFCRNSINVDWRKLSIFIF